MKELEKKQKDQVEEVKQTVQESKIVFIGKTLVRKNHILFEVDKSEMTIKKAKYEKLDEIANYKDYLGVSKKQSSKNNILDVGQSTKGKVITKPNCIYISAMNVENVLKVLVRDYGLILDK